MARVTRLPATRCPVCDVQLTAAGTMDGSDDAPEPGSWTVCSSCLAWLVFDAAMALRVVSEAEWGALSDEDRRELTRQQQAVRRAWRRPPAS